MWWENGLGMHMIPLSSKTALSMLNDELKDLEDGFLIGDSGYGCKPFKMTPYPHSSTQHQEAFNEALGKSRIKIEQSFWNLQDSISCTLKYAWIPSKFRSS